MIREADLQNFIWNKGDEWVDLIDSAELSELVSFAEDLSDISVDKLVFNRMTDRLEELFERTRAVKLFGIEVRLEREQETATRVDLLGSTPDDPSLAIIEVKKNKQTEREAFDGHS